MPCIKEMLHSESFWFGGLIGILIMGVSSGINTIQEFFILQFGVIIGILFATGNIKIKKAKKHAN